MSAWDKLKAAQHDAWALVDQAVTEDERSVGVEKRKALPFYRSGLTALNNALKINVNGITDATLKERAAKLRNKIEQNILYVKERITAIEAIPASSSTSARTKQPPAKANTVKEGAKPVLKDIDKHLADAILSDIVEPAGKGPRLDDVIGLNEAKSAMNEAIVLPALRPDLFTGVRVPPRGVLLFGPPGNGKTLLAKAVANEVNATFFSISASSLISKWMGESERLVRALFSAARQLQPSIIFLDECDSILTARHSGENDATRRMKNEFLLQCDGVGSGGDSERVVLLAATNRPWDLDDAALRRLPRRIYLPLPDAVIRSSILHHWFKKNSQQAKLSSQEIDSLAAETDGYSAADMTQLLRDAALEPLRELSLEMQRTIDRGAIRPVNATDIRNSMRKIRASAHDPSVLREYQQWNAEFGSTGL